MRLGPGVGTNGPWGEYELAIFGPISHRISETVQDRTKVATDHMQGVAYTISIGNKINDLGMDDPELTLNGHYALFYASALPTRGRECVYVLQMFCCFFLFLFFFRPLQNTRQPFLGTAERIFMKLLPNDTVGN